MHETSHVVNLLRRTLIIVGWVLCAWAVVSAVMLLYPVLATR